MDAINEGERKQRLFTDNGSLDRRYLHEAVDDRVFDIIGVKRSDIKFDGGCLSTVVGHLVFACDEMDVPLGAGPDQVAAFINFMNTRLYSINTMEKYWKVLGSVFQAAGYYFSEADWDDFNTLKLNCEAPADNKVPVSRELLRQIVFFAPPQILDGYNLKLVRCMWLAAWAFGLRVSEYTRPTRPGQNHNIWADSVFITDDALSIRFRSDKTTRSVFAIKHRSIKWSRLPEGSKQIFEEYLAARPKAARTFFCHEDGTELIYDDVHDWLQACVLLTDWRNVHITTHCFRQGRASVETYEGRSFSDVARDLRWTPTSKAMEAYLRGSVAAATPEKLIEVDPQYQVKWHLRRLATLADTIVETDGATATNAFTQAVLSVTDKVNHPELVARLPPGTYPSARVVSRKMRRAKELPNALEKLASLREKRLADAHNRERLAAQARKRQRGWAWRRSFLAGGRASLKTSVPGQGRLNNRLQKSIAIQTSPAKTNSISTQCPSPTSGGDALSIHINISDEVPEPSPPVTRAASRKAAAQEEAHSTVTSDAARAPAATVSAPPKKRGRKRKTLTASDSADETSSSLASSVSVTSTTSGSSGGSNSSRASGTRSSKQQSRLPGFSKERPGTTPHKDLAILFEHFLKGDTPYVAPDGSIVTHSELKKMRDGKLVGRSSIPANLRRGIAIKLRYAMFRSERDVSKTKKTLRLKPIPDSVTHLKCLDYAIDKLYEHGFLGFPPFIVEPDPEHEDNAFFLHVKEKIDKTIAGRLDGSIKVNDALVAPSRMG